MTKPTNILKLAGSFAKDPARGRARKNEPKPKKAIPKSSRRLDAEGKKIYKELLAEMPPGVAFNSDKFALEILAHLLSEFYSDPHVMPTSRIMAMKEMIAKFGLSPVDRIKVQAEPQKEKNEFDDL